MIEFCEFWVGAHGGFAVAAPPTITTQTTTSYTQVYPGSPTPYGAPQPGFGAVPAGMPGGYGMAAPAPGFAAAPPMGGMPPGPSYGGMPGPQPGYATPPMSGMPPAGGMPPMGGMPQPGMMGGQPGMMGGAMDGAVRSILL